jgi:hypothetical protein
MLDVYPAFGGIEWAVLNKQRQREMPIKKRE